MGQDEYKEGKNKRSKENRKGKIKGGKNIQNKKLNLYF